MKREQIRKGIWLVLMLLYSIGQVKAAEKVVVAYVTSWTETIPDPTVMTHINYAFGHVNEMSDGVRIDNPDRLRKIVTLKKKNPKLKVLLSIGGWGSGRFSEMAKTDVTRLSFAKSCRRVIEEFSIDGIDIDWEYPTQSSAGISSSPHDTSNFTLLMRDLRQQLGDKLLTCATIASGEYIDFRNCIQYLDMVNVMSYDMGNPPYHHSALYPSEITNWMTTSAAIEAHLKSGVPQDKLVMGIPLYGRGKRGYTTEPDSTQKVTEHWHEQSMVPYFVDDKGELVIGFENERSIGIKCQYITDHRLRGAMYWEYGDDHQEKLRNTICRILMHGENGPYTANYAGNRIRFRTLLIWDPSAEPAHVEFDKQAIRFFHKLSYGEGFTYDVRTSCPTSLDTLKQYDVVVMLNSLPHEKKGRKAFEQYMEQGGGWIGFHATGYNDANTHWPWLNKFLGCGSFLSNNWPPQSALLDVETRHHPVTRTLPNEFVAPASEFYQFSPSPRVNKDVEVLISISPKNYPFGIKDIVTHGDFPIVWTNKKYRMVYLNMGHGDEGFIDATQNLLFTNAFRWVASNKLRTY
ncbi:glycosyl hydrolase family 18 protein [Prevotella sp. P6B1]|uniref:glycosyl hydrolase family 18 protein n=1 Tax=Prevotella sp. P6B1 TaxID=1410613 RepID=UPI00051C76A1|nr:glycosyl hydrolase family 18 protein [Prevotella sp. P6B1]